MFTPTGFLLPLTTGWRARTSTVTCAALTAPIEVAQLRQGHSGDVDDVILDTIGAALGAAVGAPLAVRLHRGPRTRTVYDDTAV